MKRDIVNFVKHFEQHVLLARGCNSSFITLITKVFDLLTLGDHLPISLIRYTLNSIISIVCTAYIEEWNILDGPLIMNEIFKWAKKTNNKNFLLKVDFNKAFNSLNWDNLDKIMNQMGLEKLDSWLPIIFKGFNISQQITNRGILHYVSTCPRSLFHAIKLPNTGPSILHLFYVDYAIFVGEWNGESIKNLFQILKCFHISLGPKVNFLKS
uniref:Reverse transcriptase domain-containing protein n=1 Tax=Lactuca sativa TaxID=4236 RepID=A0A9R1VN25_LACSA|nr:hypothetical protein LSAT_V11C500246900 [Lactuca sativa]